MLNEHPPIKGRDLRVEERQIKAQQDALDMAKRCIIHLTAEGLNKDHKRFRDIEESVLHCCFAHAIRD